MEDNQAYKAIFDRRSVRSFSQQEIPLELLLHLLSLANRAPSGFNLQPWEFIVVKDQAIRNLLCHAAMEQKQVAEAPVTVVFLANPRAWKETFPEILKEAQQNGSLSPDRVKRYSTAVKLLFTIGPFGLFGFLKKLAVPLKRIRGPVPNIITTPEQARHYVRSQTMIAASTFMIAAKAAGLDTCPMEGFDEERVKKLLRIPGHFTIPVIIPVGYSLEVEEVKPTVRLPVESRTSIDLYGQKLKITH